MSAVNLDSSDFHCPSCGSRVARISIRSTGVIPALIQCVSCKAEMFWPIPDQSTLDNFYSSDNYFSELSKNQAVSYLSDPTKVRSGVAYFAKGLADAGVLPPQRVLEIGCNYGCGMIELARLGYEAWGVDLAPDGIAFLHQHGVNAYAGTILDDEFPIKSCDAIYSSHTLEHMPDPYAALRRIHDILRPGGYLQLCLPHWGSLIAQIQRTKWQWFVYPAHIHYFSAYSFCNILENIGFVELEFGTSHEASEAQRILSEVTSNIDKGGVDAICAALKNANLGEQLYIKARKQHADRTPPSPTRSS